MTIQSLVLTDGTTTATLTDGTNYALASGGWSPQVARLRTGELGGVGPYDEVEETIEIDIMGGGVLATLSANIAKIMKLCDQAQRWRRGENVAAVQLQITLTGSTVKTAVVVEGVLELPSNYADVLVIREVERARLRVTRRGMWLGTEVAATTLTNVFPGVAWTTSPAVTSLGGVESPTKLRIAVPNTGHVKLDNALLIVASQETGNLMTVIEAESVPLPATNSKWAVVGDVANFASDSNVLRYNHASVNTNAVTSKSTVSLPKNPTIYAVVRTTVANTVFTLSVGLYTALGKTITLTKTIGPIATAGQCQVVSLGSYTGSVPFGGFDLTCTQTAGTAAALDIDVLVFAPQRASAIRFTMPLAVSGVASGFYGFFVQHNMLAEPTPTFEGADSSGFLIDSIAYEGNIYLSAATDALDVCLLAPVGVKWTPGQAAAPTIRQTYTVNRSSTKAYLTPE